MMSVYQDYLSSLNGESKVVRPKDKDKLDLVPTLEKTLAISKALLKNAKMACNVLLNGRISELDPIVGENACQIRMMEAEKALSDDTLLKEAQSNVKKIAEQEKMIVKVMNALQKVDIMPHNKASTLLARLNLNVPISEKMNDITMSNLLFDDLMNELGLSLDVSEKMLFILRSHLLTAGKYFYMNRNGDERSGIDASNLSHKLSSKIERETLEDIIHCAKEQISKQSVIRIQQESSLLSEQLTPHARHMEKQLQGKCIRQVKVTSMGDEPLVCDSSCAFYNLKAIMARAREKQLPILIKQYREKGLDSKDAVDLLYQSEKPGSAPKLLSGQQKGSLDAKQPIYVIECYFPKNIKEEELVLLIEKAGLIEVILANVSLVPQYSADDDISVLDDEAQMEIDTYRQLGKKLGCQTSHPSVFSIAHTHAATMQEELVLKSKRSLIKK